MKEYQKELWYIKNFTSLEFSMKVGKYLIYHRLICFSYPILTKKQ